MALIDCPECGGKVSDKARACPSCGFLISGMIKCEECGSMVKKSAKTCPSCGCPIESASDPVVNITASAEKVTAVPIADAASVKHRSFAKIFVPIIIVLLLIAASAAVYFKFFRTIQVENREYISNDRTVTYTGGWRNGKPYGIGTSYIEWKYDEEVQDDFYDPYDNRKVWLTGYWEGDDLTDSEDLTRVMKMYLAGELLSTEEYSGDQGGLLYGGKGTLVVTQSKRNKISFTYEGDCKDGKANGNGKMTIGSTIEMEGEFIDNSFIKGKRVTINSDIRIEDEGEFDNYMLVNGSRTQYFSSGGKWVGEGEFEGFRFDDDLLNGTDYMYDSDGKLMLQRTFVNGMVDNVTEY